MTLSNNQNPSDDKNSREPSRDDSGDLSFPPAPRAYHNRLLVDTYFKNCKRGFLEHNKIITSLKEMDYEDRVSLDGMADAYRELVRSKLRHFGFRDLENDITLRFLHPVVAVGKTRREHHIYVDVVDRNGRCCFVDGDAASSFESGPAAMQVSRIAGDEKRPRILLTKLFSRPAFHEAINTLIAAPWSEVYSNPRAFVALGWLMRGIATARAREAEARAEGGTEQDFLALSTVEDFMWTGSRKPHTFECSVGKAFYVIQVALHDRTRQPMIYVHEERF